EYVANGHRRILLLCRTAKYRKKSPICSWFVLNSDRLLGDRVVAQAAPGVEAAPVGGVGCAGRGGPRGLDVEARGGDLLGQCRQGGGRGPRLKCSRERGSAPPRQSSSPPRG